MLGEFGSDALLQRLDEDAGVLQVVLVAAAGHHAQRAAGAAGPLLVLDLVEIRKLLARLVHRVEVRVAAHDQQLVRLVLGRRERPGGDLRQVLRRREVGELLVVHVLVVLRVHRLHDVRRHDVEAALRHVEERGRRLRRAEGPADGVVVDLLELGRHVVELPGVSLASRVDVRVADVVFPGEDHIVGVERHAVRPLDPFHQLHGQLLAVGRPFPALGELRQRLDIGIGAEERPRAHQRIVAVGVGIDAEPAGSRTGGVVPAGGGAGGEEAAHVAVDAQAIRHAGLQDDPRFLRQAILDRRQLAGLHQVGDPRGFLVFGQRLVGHDLADLLALHRLGAHFDLGRIRVGDGGLERGRGGSGGLGRLRRLGGGRSRCLGRFGRFGGFRRLGRFGRGSLGRCRGGRRRRGRRRTCRQRGENDHRHQRVLQCTHNLHWKYPPC